MLEQKGDAEKAEIIIFQLEKNSTHKFFLCCYPSTIKIRLAHCFNQINMFDATQGKSMKFSS
jgi:hypothetical protein